LSRLEIEIDKQANYVTAVYDLQAVLPCPLGNASSFYYVSKLNVFNFTVYDLQTNDVQCYVWHECQAHRGANDIGSCILNYLKVLQKNATETEASAKLDVIFYSDNCVEQQKNKFIYFLRNSYVFIFFTDYFKCNILNALKTEYSTQIIII